MVSSGAAIYGIEKGKKLNLKLENVNYLNYIITASFILYNRS